MSRVDKSCTTAPRYAPHGVSPMLLAPMWRIDIQQNE